MPSTDIDGSVIVILGTEEARAIGALLSATSGSRPLTEIERKVAEKIARDLTARPCKCGCRCPLPSTPPRMESSDDD